MCQKRMYKNKYNSIEVMSIRKFLKNVNYNDYPPELGTFETDMNKYNDFAIEKYSSDDLYYFVISKDEMKYIALPNTPSRLWMRGISITDLTNLWEGDIDRSMYSKTVYAYMGDKSGISFVKLIQYILLSPFTQKNIYTSETSEQRVDNISTLERAFGIPDVNDNIHDLIFYTKYSDSSIRIYETENGLFMALSYDPIGFSDIEEINNELDRNYETDLPIDVLAFIINFPYFTWRDLITELGTATIDICLEMVKYDSDELEHFIEHLRKIDNADDIKNVVVQYDIHIQMNKIMKNDIYNDFRTKFNELVSMVNAIGDDSTEDYVKGLIAGTLMKSK